jgi:hypothetical protein
MWHVFAAAAAAPPTDAGIVQPPIPYPAVNQSVHIYPPDVFPWDPRPMQVRLQYGRPNQPHIVIWEQIAVIRGEIFTL